MAYEVQLYDGQLKERMAGLLTHLLSSNPELNQRYFEWKYEANPFISPPLVMVVTAGSRIVGMRGMFGASWYDHLENRRVVLPHADDLVIHPEHRGRGLFIPLMEALLARAGDMGFDHVISLSGGATTQALSVASGWSQIGDIGRLVYRADQHRKRRRALLHAARRQFRTLIPQRLKSAWRRRSSSRIPSEVAIDGLVQRITRAEPLSVEGPEFFHRAADLVGEWSSCGVPQIAADRSATSLEWRLANPSRRYRVLSWSAPQLSGFMILSWTSANARCVKVADIQTDDDGVFSEMIGAVRESGFVEVEVMTPRMESRRRILEQMGFGPEAELKPGAVQRRFLIQRTQTSGKRPQCQDLLSRDWSQWSFNLLETMQA